MLKLVDEFQATLTKDLTASQVVDMYQGQKFTLHKMYREAGENVLIKKFVDSDTNHDVFIIPSGKVRFEGIPGMDPETWRPSPRGEINIGTDCFQKKGSRRRIIDLLLDGWGNKTVNTADI
ncbi:hypothetical protein M2444_004663 [Paenibacillus sp. PastF-3]|uniref:hypothetical protein n=1 Tax=Paenibacillus sp. PastF-3 TaxID=2940626 RepID=UPI0024740570|nr:hypothetical protein [Paenibacillus sp. PastF-3]MDH6372834.1 hypothetical protein [Paenibacillus sp. PastF-3]